MVVVTEELGFKTRSEKAMGREATSGFRQIDQESEGKVIDLINLFRIFHFRREHVFC